MALAYIQAAASGGFEAFKCAIILVTRESRFFLSFPGRSFQAAIASIN
jgi:hypothetical protein